jgi:hypothetical protein
MKAKTLAAINNKKDKHLSTSSIYKLQYTKDKGCLYKTNSMHHVPKANVFPYSDPRYFNRASIATPKPRPPIRTPSSPCPAPVVLSHEVVGLRVSSAAVIRSLQVSTCSTTLNLGWCQH